MGYGHTCVRGELGKIIFKYPLYFRYESKIRNKTKFAKKIQHPQNKILGSQLRGRSRPDAITKWEQILFAFVFKIFHLSSFKIYLYMCILSLVITQLSTYQSSTIIIQRQVSLKRFRWCCFKGVLAYLQQICNRSWLDRYVWSCYSIQ